MDFSWNEAIQAFMLGAFPWISQFKKLDIHFRLKDIEIRSIYNFFASLFSFSIFFYLNYSHPDQLMDLLGWWWFISFSFLLTSIYFTIFFFFREKVNLNILKWPVIINFFVYVLIFCMLTTGYGLLRVYKDYLIIEGKVVEESTGKGIAQAEITIDDSEAKTLKNIVSDRKGRFKVLLNREKNELSRCKTITVEIFSYSRFEKTLKEGTSLIYHIKKIKLSKMEN